MIQEQSLGFKRAYDEVAIALQNQARQVSQLRKEGEASIAQANARFNEAEDRCASIESRMAEAASREASNIDRICDRQERLWHAVESLKLLKSEVEGERGSREAFEDRLAVDIRSIDVRIIQLSKQTNKMIQDQDFDYKQAKFK